jgi:hypothetical protein
MPEEVRATLMSVKLNNSAFDHAKKLIEERQCVVDDKDAWSEHQPSTADENSFLHIHGVREYSRWYLGVDDEEEPDTKGHYKFPYGDFQKVHRCGVLAAESRAAQRHYNDVRSAAAHLHGMLDALG